MARWLAVARQLAARLALLTIAAGLIVLAWLPRVHVIGSLWPMRCCHPHFLVLLGAVVAWGLGAVAIIIALVMAAVWLYTVGWPDEGEHG